jgi:superfamily II DNA or RNA helicase
MGAAERALLRRTYRVPLGALGDGELEVVRRELTLSGTEDDPRPLPLWRTTERALYVPRFYGERRWGKAAADEAPSGDRVELVFAGELDASRRQVEASEALSAAFARGHGGCLHLACGMGKTSVALWAIAHYGRKALVVVHKEFLMNQWRERIAQFLPSARVGLVQGPVLDVEDKDVVLAMMQSVSMKEYAPGAFDSFGMVVVDEAHRVCARMFSRCLPKVGARVMLGLTATPNRKDGFDAVLGYHLGPPLFGATRDTEPVKVFRHVTDMGDNPLEITYKNGKVGISKMITWLSQHRGRNRLIRRLVESELRSGRRVLLLSERRAHLEELEAWANGLFGAGSAGLYMGGLKRETLDASERCGLVLGTYAMSSEGLDLRGMHTLVLATPRTDIEQSVGRILRDGDAEKRCYDIVDSYSVFAGQGWKRLRYFRDKGYDVRTVDHRPHEAQEAQESAAADADASAALWREIQIDDTC